MPFSEPGFGIYIHWPFCKAKCPYCDFNSHVRHRAVDTMDFAEALITELAWLAGGTQGRCVDSIFFGGGTPSLMPPAAVAQIIDAVVDLWPVRPEAEITLEANPTSAEAENFRGYRLAGVNRVSVGVQALDENDLRALGRRHSPEEAIAAFRLASRIFPRVSFDLIYARPNQSRDQWKSELTRALAEQQGHMSLYQLTIEPGTAFAELFACGALVMPDEHLSADLFDMTQEMTAETGLFAYEISNHARAGHESRHNLIYWRYGDYAGAGPGAHSRIGRGDRRRALAAERHPETWRSLVAMRGHGMVEDAILSPADQAREYLLMGLRTIDGINLARHAELAADPLDDAKIESLQALGLVRRTTNRLAATSAGRRILNSVIAELAA